MTLRKKENFFILQQDIKWLARSTIKMNQRFFSILCVSFIITDIHCIKVSKAINCKQYCKKETRECGVQCRKEEHAFDRPDVLECLQECSVESMECKKACDCLSQCAREVDGCNDSCESHPFQRKIDKLECYKECWYDSNQCTDTCQDIV